MNSPQVMVIQDDLFSTADLFDLVILLVTFLYLMFYSGSKKKKKERRKKSMNRRSGKKYIVSMNTEYNLQKYLDTNFSPPLIFVVHIFSVIQTENKIVQMATEIRKSLSLDNPVSII